MEERFEIKLWNEVTDLLKNNREQRALYCLYYELNTHNNLLDINNFLGHVLYEKLNSDVIVHILNSVSPHKSKLSNWDKFLEKSKLSLKNEVGDKIAKQLLNVIRDDFDELTLGNGKIIKL